MRTTLNISFPDDLYLFVRERVEAGAYASTSEYIRALVREDRSRSDSARTLQRPTRSTVRRANETMRGSYAAHDEP